MLNADYVLLSVSHRVRTKLDRTIHFHQTICSEAFVPVKKTWFSSRRILEMVI